ncbi:hypothetical protein AO398_00485 [Methylobacterium sp. GXS13]|jgi:hypothetical protein|uniref:hypothetical protein n=1 Tax=Methylobacterium sp. GXS13 TaxID=1730094 RepID=UPI00071C0053|nr:hypothetical protein [Methylobacterium sp. GXS13]KST61202.1 hypothetical protein AO398_00485 [Methylobacterium sp. GXS13]
MTRPAPSAALLERLAHRFGDAPGHAAWRARIAASPADPKHVTRYVLENPDADPAPPRGGHTELVLERFTEQDARIRRGGGLPACWSAYS